MVKKTNDKKRVKDAPDHVPAREEGGKWVKGQSANPAGRPPGRTVQKEIREAAVEKIEWWFEIIFLKPEEELIELVMNSKELSRADKVILGKSDGITVIESILDRIVGKPAQVKVDNESGSESVESFLRRLMNGGANGQD